MDKMRWNRFEEMVLGRENRNPLVALIVDSPWIRQEVEYHQEPRERT